jgi:hypothetical protein
LRVFTLSENTQNCIATLYSNNDCTRFGGPPLIIRGLTYHQVVNPIPFWVSACELAGRTQGGNVYYAATAQSTKRTCYPPPTKLGIIGRASDTDLSLGSRANEPPPCPAILPRLSYVAFALPQYTSAGALGTVVVEKDGLLNGGDCGKPGILFTSIYQYLLANAPQGYTCKTNFFSDANCQTPTGAPVDPPCAIGSCTNNILTVKPLKLVCSN